MTENKETTYANKNAILVIACLSCAIQPYIIGSINIALPAINKEFSATAVTMSWIVSSFLLASAIVMVPGGRIADIYGQRRVFIWGAIAQTIASLGVALSPNATWLIVTRVMQGITVSLTFVTATAILVSSHPASDRGRILGISIAAVYTGGSLSPFLAGLLTQHLGWRSIYYVCALLSLIITVGGFWKIKGEWRAAKGESFDILGTVIYSPALIAIIYAFSVLPGSLGIWLLVGGIAALVGFIFWESKIASPILDVNLIRHNRVFALSNLSALLNYSSAYAFGYLLSLYLQYIKGFTAQTAGFIMIVQPIVMAITATFSGKLSNLIAPHKLSSIGMGLTATGLFLLIFLNGETHIAQIMVSQVIVGMGFGCFSSPNQNVIFGSVDRKYYGVATGISGTMRTLGQILSLGVSTLLFALFIGHAQITPAYYPQFLQSIHIAFIISTALCVAGVFTSLVRNRAQGVVVKPQL